MQAHNYYFDVSSAVTGKNDVVIGENCGWVPMGKLDIENSLEDVGVWSATTNTTSPNTWGMYTYAAGVTTGQNIGITAFGENGANSNIGGAFTSVGPSSSTFNYGVKTSASGGTNSIGVFANAQNGTNLYGVWGTTNWGTSNNNYAIYGYLPGPGTGNNWAGYFVGYTYTPAGVFHASDSILKNNLQVINTPSKLLSSIKTYSFTYDSSAYPNMGLPSGTHYGFVAQNVGATFPNMVKNAVQPAIYDSLGRIITPSVTFKTVNYDEFIPILVSGYQQQQQSIDSLRHNPSGIGGNGTPNYVPQFTGNGTTLGNSPMAVSNNYVGIGTAAPGTLLELKDPTNTGSNYQPTGDGLNSGDGLRIRDLNDWRAFIGSPGTVILRNSSYASQVFLNANGASFLTGGNVGIGTFSPAALFTVTPSANNARTFWITNASGQAVFSLVPTGSGDASMYLFDASNNNNIQILSNGTSYFNGGNIIIGNSTAQFNSALSVYSANGSVQNGADFYNTSNSNNVYANVSADGTNNGQFLAWDNTGTRRLNLSAGSVSYFNGGNVGIGNAHPMAQLDLVNSTSNVQFSQGFSSVVNGTGNGVNYAIYASASGANAANYAGYFNGDVYTTGSYLPSDANLKTNIDSTHLCSRLLCQLKPCTFNYNSSYPSLNLPSGTCYGLIAQDVQNVFPQLVHTVVQPAQIDTAGDTLQKSVTFKTVNYTAFIPLLIKGYQDQQKKIDSLTNVLAGIQQCVSTLCAQNGTPGGHKKTSNPADSSTNVQNVTLSSMNSAMLYQNTPNPFSTGTKINYFLPEGTQEASMLFFDMYGNKIKEVSLQQTGMGALNITPDNLKDGVYSYSLVISGQVVDTKKMVLQK